MTTLNHSLYNCGTSCQSCCLKNDKNELKFWLFKARHMLYVRAYSVKSSKGCQILNNGRWHSRRLRAASRRILILEGCVIILWLLLAFFLLCVVVGVVGVRWPGGRPSAVPAAIDELLHQVVGSPHHQLREGGDLDLVCLAKGRPLPTVTWKYQVSLSMPFFSVKPYYFIILLKGKSTQRRRVHCRRQSKGVKRPPDR